MKFPQPIHVAFLSTTGLLLLAGCGRQSLAPQPSPDGSMLLVTSLEKPPGKGRMPLCLAFEIRSTNGTVLHRENTRGSDTMRWSMAWQDNSTVTLESSDIGTYSWQRQEDGSWKKLSPY